MRSPSPALTDTIPLVRGVFVDESRDVSIKEQMSVVLHYVNSKGHVIEHFLAIEHVPNTTSISLKAALDDLFSRHGLSISHLRGQGYDGDSNMQGELVGLKTLILNENASAYYVHCFAHQLQLTLVTVAKRHLKIASVFFLLTNVVNVVGGSCKRCDRLREQQADKVIEALSIGEISNGRGFNQETSLIRATHVGDHLMVLCLRDNGWDSMLNQASLFCQKHDIEVCNMDDMFLLPGRSHRKASKMTNLHYYRVELYYAVIDLQLMELENRFNETSTELLISMAYLNSKNSFEAFNKGKLIRLARFYPSDFSEMELMVLEDQLGTNVLKPGSTRPVQPVGPGTGWKTSSIAYFRPGKNRPVRSSLINFLQELINLLDSSHQFPLQIREEDDSSDDISITIPDGEATETEARNVKAKSVKAGKRKAKSTFHPFFTKCINDPSQPTIKSARQSKEKLHDVDLAVAMWFYDAYAKKSVSLLIDSYRSQWIESGCTIMSDGWRDIRQRHLINFLVYCPKGISFLKFVDASDIESNALNLCNLFAEIFEMVGKKNVVQMVTDNASNYKLAGSYLCERYTSITWSPCAAHCLNLVLNDVSELDNIKSLVTLSSRYAHDNLCYKREVFQGVLDMVEKNFRGSNVIDLTMALGKFRDSEGTFGRPSAVASCTITRPDEWWKLFGGDTPVLQKFAIRILSQTASSSSCERNWSVFERIHTKRRNRLEHQRLNDLVFVHYNLRLQNRLALTLPVATATVERAFSAMNIVKNRLHSKMGDQWMNDNLVAYIEKDVFAEVGNEVIIDMFQKMKSRRRHC
ncbi:hypothetical protein OSB04_031180 [Centaurea solstitialis]|uniref:Uncharacterized protein n=1 Tax=Centaurea solstitialis TaxID=347529 RepID=A0AA38VU21_9ASTR|nr:hypothetical protein OSB04_031180 [Centaurea solstitialis]